MIATDETTKSDRLRRLEAVADATLSRLDVADLFDELLERVRDLLDVDTAAILLLDTHARQLVATAARGIEEEVRQGFRIAVGQGFAGRVAATKRPVAINDVTPADVLNPLLLQKGIRSLLGVPMFAGPDVIGVLHIGTLTPRRFTDDDIHLLELVADRAGLASRARASAMDQAAAVALQHSLLPTRLPRVPGVDLAARYLPGHAVGIGGDWFDVFTLPSGWLGVVIGDVSGHGLQSAVVMGRVRSALRSYALVCDDPAEALSLLDRKVQHFEAGSLTTALYAMLPPDRSAIHISIAGHLRPILAVPGQPAAMMTVRVDPPLGIGRRPIPRQCSVVDFPPRAALACYTDGLVERRGQLIDIGIDRLAAAVRPGPAETTCATIMDALAPDQPTDDVALLVVGRTAEPSPAPGDTDAATRG
jgi:putative methionine-R-sulfoxide reductase with GAF domain